jgi:hypothetical protein
VISGWSMSLSRLSRCEGEGASGRALQWRCCHRSLKRHEELALPASWVRVLSIRSLLLSVPRNAAWLLICKGFC